MTFPLQERDGIGRGEWIDLVGPGTLDEAIFEPLFALMGEAVFSLIVTTVVVLGLHAWTEDFFIPAIFLALFGGSTIAFAPAPAARIGTLIVVCAVAVALYAIWDDGP